MHRTPILYERSAHLSQATYPWLISSLLPSQTDHRFAKLKTCLEEQTPEQANEANSLLLITFTDILAALIGEQLTSSILRSAWGKDTLNLANKEFKNE